MPEEKTSEEQPKDHPKEIKTLLEWQSAWRPFKRRDYKFYQTVGLILLLAAAFVIFFQEFLLVGVFLALFFVLYVMGTVEPETIEHKITTQGITTGGHSYIWDDLHDFWFTEKNGSVILNVSTKLRFPPRLLILVPYLEREKVKETLVKYLPYREEAQRSWMDETADWFTARLPTSLR